MPPKSAKTKSAKPVATPGTPRAVKVAKVSKATIAKPKPVPRAAASSRRAVMTRPAVPETPSGHVSESPPIRIIPAFGGMALMTAILFSRGLHRFLSHPIKFPVGLWQNRYAPLLEKMRELESEKKAHHGNC